MSFEEEWRQAHASAAANVAMRLNRADNGPSGPNGPGAADLSVRRDDLGVVGGDAFKLHDGLKRDGNHARESTGAAATALTARNFTSGGELAKVRAKWDTQLRTLSDACAQISNHLDYSMAAHAKDDERVGGELIAVSRIDEYLK
ncbi:hypothetical protein [Streptomyces melanogenes]|uniref:AG1 protein n=1 Tax=Streptomyces melanogenes TaxID=67326 RepID=A0ABZ1XLF3_9ACTN|nr:hypothetical protein [Streptomyces melanogenes]